MGNIDHDVIARTPAGRKSVKKALLIGSGLEGAPEPEGCRGYPPLGRAVKDTRELAGLLNCMSLDRLGGAWAERYLDSGVRLFRGEHRRACRCQGCRSKVYANQG